MTLPAPASDNIEQLRRLADANGVATGFWDWYGNWVGVGAHTLLKVLGALGLPLDESSSTADVDDALRLTEERPWRRTLPPTIVARQGGGYEFPVHVPDGAWVNVQWVLEDGRKGFCEQLDRYVPPRMIDGRMIGTMTTSRPRTDSHRATAMGVVTSTSAVGRSRVASYASSCASSRTSWRKSDEGVSSARRPPILCFTRGWYRLNVGKRSKNKRNITEYTENFRQHK